MFGKLAALKDIIWAIGIVVCLIALAVGFIFAAAVKYDGSGQLPDPGAVLQDVPAGGEAGGETGVLRALPETADGGQAYIDSLTFLCDSALIGLRDYGLLSGGAANTQVWGSSAGNIPAADIGQCIIKYPGDGSEISAVTAAAAVQPSILVISLGSDSLASTTREDFITNYTTLVTGIQAASPGTRIICCSVTGISATYAGSDGLTVDLISQANEWITQVCADTGVYYADVASAVSDSSGVLFQEVAASNGKTLNSAGLSAVLSYLSTHTV